MKINNIVGFNYTNSLNAENKTVPNYQNTEYKFNKNKFAYTPLYTNQYLAQFIPFTGGYSIDLAQTAKELDDKAYPPDIKEMVENTLSKGNKDDKTLIDIHKEKYGKINQMKSLDEVKAAFPEFKDVLSDSEVDYYKNSFIDDVKTGKLEWFDEDTDIALQLLQMYWADGFSLNDLKEYTGGKNIDGVLDKLNIERFDKIYARVLKLSDKEYNERFTKQMSERLTGIEKKKAEKRDGVYIPRGPMSEEQKKKISESLCKFYSEHPEKIIKMSERMKQYYEEHPEEKENLSNVLEISWNLFDAKSIRKKMSKFLGKKDISAEEFAKLNLSEDKTEKRTLKDFWDRNIWAKKQWSVCMSKGWEIYKKQKEEEEDRKNLIPITIYPPSMEHDIKMWLRAKEYNLSKITDFTKAYARTDGKELPQADRYTDNAVNAYFNEIGADMQADMYHVCLLKTLSDVFSSKTIDDMTRYTISLFIAQELEIMPGDKGYKEMTTDNLINIYSKLYLDCIKDDRKDIIKIFDENLDKAYRCIKSDNKIMAKKIGLKAQKTVCILMAAQELERMAFVPEKTEQEMVHNVILPVMKKDIVDSITKSGIGIMSDEEMKKRISDEDVCEMLNLYLQDKNTYNNLENACQLSMLKTINELLDEAEYKDYPNDKRDTVYAIRNFFFFKNFDEKTHIKKVELKDLCLCFENIVNFANTINYPDIAQKFEQNLDKTYCTIRDFGTDAAIDEIFKKTSKKEQ